MGSFHKTLAQSLSSAFFDSCFRKSIELTYIIDGVAYDSTAADPILKKLSASDIKTVDILRPLEKKMIICDYPTDFLVIVTKTAFAVSHTSSKKRKY